MKEKDKEKLRSQIQTVIPKLGAFRQAFCWAIFPLFQGENNALSVGENMEVKPLLKSKENEISDSALLEALQESKASSFISKRKTIPGKCTLDIRVIDNETTIDGRVTPSLIPINQKMSKHVKSLFSFRFVDFFDVDCERTTRLSSQSSCVATY